MGYAEPELQQIKKDGRVLLTVPPTDVGGLRVVDSQRRHKVPHVCAPQVRVIGQRLPRTVGSVYVAKHMANEKVEQLRERLPEQPVARIGVGEVPRKPNAEDVVGGDLVEWENRAQWCQLL